MRDEFAAFINRKLTVKGSFQVPGGPNAHELDCDFVVGGDGTPGSEYHVIALAPHLGGYDHSYYGDRQGWIRKHLAAAVQEDPRKPIFLLTHIPMADPRSIYQDDGFTLVQTATFANNFWMSGDGSDESGDDGGNPDAGQDASQCELVEIDAATNAATIYRLDFREGAVLGEPWAIDVASGADGFRYTTERMASSSGAPVVDADVRVTVTGGVSDARFMSDYYKAAADRERAFERPLFGAALEAGRDYVLAAYAVNAFGKESKIGETTFRVA